MKKEALQIFLAFGLATLSLPMFSCLETIREQSNALPVSGEIHLQIARMLVVAAGSKTIIAALLIAVFLGGIYAAYIGNGKTARQLQLTLMAYALLVNAALISVIYVTIVPQSVVLG